MLAYLGHFSTQLVVSGAKRHSCTTSVWGIVAHYCSHE